MTLETSGAISVGNAAGSNRSLNIEFNRNHNAANTSLSTLAGISHEYRAQFDNLENTPHAVSEWYGYDHTITWEHEITVGHGSYTISKTTYQRYGYDASAVDAYSIAHDFGAISESSPRWAEPYLNLGWLVWDSNNSSLIFLLYRSIGATPWGNQGFGSVQIQTITGGNTYGVGPLNRTAATYNLSDGSSNDPRFEKWVWTHASVGGLASSPFHTTVGATSTIRWR